MKYAVFFAMLFLFSCKTYKAVEPADDKNAINTTLDAWHKAAAEAKFDDYFALMTADGVFIGTDATENWQNEAFRNYSKPYFDKGRAWNFTSVERNVYFSDDKKTAWFDELLNTQMKICRGSGILKKENGKWKIAHYVLSIAIPNDNTDEVIKLKTGFDDALLKKLQSK